MKRPPPTNARTSRSLVAWAACAVTIASLFTAALAGCGRYQVGVGPLYRSDISTVYVPMFRSNSYRRNFGERLTEAVIKEIEARTPYKVVDTPNADSILTGEIYSTTKTVRVEAPTDEPRELGLTVSAKVSWVDRKGDMIRQAVVAMPPPTSDILGEAQLVPEVGQTAATAYQQALVRVAKQIVDMMEPAWGEEPTPAFSGQ